MLTILFPEVQSALEDLAASEAQKAGVPAIVASLEAQFRNPSARRPVHQMLTAVLLVISKEKEGGFP